jgi:asparagine synthase (glutamine-hydrolysing)
LPESHLKKPKMGFGIPIDELLRKDLATWAMDLLDPQSIKDEGYLNHELISDMWSKHLRSEGNFGYLLWDILMFQTWYRNQKV